MRESISQAPGAAAKSRRTFTSCYSQLAALHALGQVWLPDSVLQQLDKLALRSFRPASFTKNAASHVNLGPENTVHEGLDLLIQTCQPCLLKPLRLAA